MAQKVKVQWRQLKNDEAIRGLHLFGGKGSSPVPDYWDELRHCGMRWAEESWIGELEEMEYEHVIPKPPPKKIALATRWQSVEDALPDNDRTVIVRHVDGGTARRNLPIRTYKDVGITHWIDLPEVDDE